MVELDEHYARWGRIMAFSNVTLTAELAALLGGAMGTILNTKSVVMVGRDYRRDSRALKRSFTGGLMASGIEVIDLHAVPTSILQFSIRRFGADAGVMFTRSHNLAGMVSIKLFDSTGIEFESEKTNKVVQLAETKNIRRVDSQEIGWITVADAMTVYDRSLAGFFSSSQNIISQAKLRVVVDCACGPVSLIMPDLLNEFGCEVITLNAHRPRNPAFLPKPESLSRLGETVKVTGSSLGIALDAEGRHAIIIDSQGRIRSAEETASVNLHSRYDPNPNATVVVGSTVHPSVYQGLNKNIIFVDHGEPGGIGRAVMQHRAIYGFNDSGLYVLPVFSPGSDGLIAALTVLEQLAKEQIDSTELYRKHQIFAQRQAEVTFPVNKMLKFFRTILNSPPEQYHAIDTFIGIKLIRKTKEWIHFFLADQSETLHIEVFDPTSNIDNQRKMISYTRELVDNFLNESVSNN